jgi:hypothetical protein
MPSSLSAPAGQLPRLLPLDYSAYADTMIPTSAFTHSSTSLAELAHLIRHQRYQDQRRSQSRVRLHRWLVSEALSSRLLHCGEMSYKTLMDMFRKDDKKGFSVLHSALHDVRNSCDATRRYALLEPDLDNGKTKLAQSDSTSSFSTFMHEIPNKIRNDLLEFISAVRNDQSFLATCVANLTQPEIVALASFRPTLDPNELAVMATGKLPPPKKKAVPVTTASPVERLLSFQRHDPLSALIYTVFANSSGPDSNEDMLRTEAWATTCVKLIQDAKPGSETLIRSILDVWAAMRDWPAKYNLELYLMQVLQEGQFLIEKPDLPTKAVPQGEKSLPKELEYAAEEFFERSIKRLFELIDDEPSAGGLPEGVVEIGSAIVRKLGHNKKHRQSAEIVIIHRWFFSTFLLNALIFPEVRVCKATREARANQA